MSDPEDRIDVVLLTCAAQNREGLKKLPYLLGAVVEDIICPILDGMVNTNVGRIWCIGGGPCSEVRYLKLRAGVKFSDLIHG